MHTKSAIEIQGLFLSGKHSAVEIATHFLKRIEELDPKIKAFTLVLKERALKKAAELDQKKKEGKPLGKLAGIPIAIKDNIHIDGEVTTCASKFLLNFKAPFSATVVELLENEGAIILGKTNLDEFAMGSSTENSALFSTKNPIDFELVPGGSSGGSAAAVAARMVPLALGSDTGGSIRQPASLCGVVGFKPTYGRVSRFGLVAFGSSLDQIGPFAHSVKDAALVMEVLGRHCERDSTSIEDGAEEIVSQCSDTLAGKTVGVPEEFLSPLKGEAKELFDQAIEKLKKKGAKIVNVDLSLLKYSLAVYYILATAEASTNLARFDGIRFGLRAKKAETLDEIYDFSKEEGYGKEVKRRIMLGTFVLSSGYQDAYYKQAQKVRTLIIRQFEQAFKICDLIAMPVSPFGAFKIGAIQDPIEMYLADIYTIAANLAGIPAISVPAGVIEQYKPFGLQLHGPQKHDKAVFSAAYAFEKEGS